MIEVKHLSKSYGDKLALDDISFSIGAGEVVGLLGLNGAGKSTTMNILTGYISASNGEVSIDGFDIVNSAKQAKSVIGYLPEQLAFYPEMAVDEYLNFIWELKGLSNNKEEKEREIAEVCERCGITHIQKRMIRNLSKGYRQRVGFAQALIGKPKVLILDEPTVGLDPSQIIEIRELIRESGKESTVIVSSHILSEIQSICDRVIVLNGGKIIADDTPTALSKRLHSTNKLVIRVKGEQEIVKNILEEVEEIKKVTPLSQQEPDTYDYAILGKRGVDIRSKVFFALAKAELPLVYMYGNETSLEDVFLNLIGDTYKDAEGGRV